MSFLLSRLGTLYMLIEVVYKGCVIKGAIPWGL